jgi:hypothetical protein
MPNADPPSVKSASPGPLPQPKRPRLAQAALTPVPDPSPSDVMYDDMTRAWRNGDTALAGSLADALIQYLADGGQPLTRDRDLYYALRIYARYAPVPDDGDPDDFDGEHATAHKLAADMNVTDAIPGFDY